MVTIVVRSLSFRLAAVILILKDSSFVARSLKLHDDRTCFNHAEQEDFKARCAMRRASALGR